jgi:hypothetical protein
MLWLVPMFWQFEGGDYNCLRAARSKVEGACCERSNSQNYANQRTRPLEPNCHGTITITIRDVDFTIALVLNWAIQSSSESTGTMTGPPSGDPEGASLNESPRPVSKTIKGRIILKIPSELSVGKDTRRKNECQVCVWEMWRLSGCGDLIRVEIRQSMQVSTTIGQVLPHKSLVYLRAFNAL